MDKNIYLHAISSVPDDYYHSKETTKVLLKILKRRALLCTRLQRKGSYGGFNGGNYVSLCDYEKRNKYKNYMGKYNAYHTYIRYSLSLAFPKDKIEVIKPKILDGIYAKDSKGFYEMERLGKSKKERYTDMPDEVQVRDSVSLEHLSLATFPVHLLKTSKGFTIDEKASIIMYEIEEIDRILSSYGFNIPIYDIDTLEELTSSSKVKMLIKNM